MKFVHFKSQDDYLKAQRSTALRRGRFGFFTDVEIFKISEWLVFHKITVSRGICHGARGGLECLEFQKHFPEASFVGTDLFPYLGRSAKHKSRKVRVRQWDFRNRRSRWVGAFDVVYSNSLDHTDDPESTLRVWIEQLNQKGVMAIQWSTAHTKIKRGDCFGGELQEYIDLMNSVGRLVELIYVNVPFEKYNSLRRRALKAVILIVQKAESEAKP